MFVTLVRGDIALLAFSLFNRNVMYLRVNGYAVVMIALRIWHSKTFCGMSG